MPSYTSIINSLLRTFPSEKAKDFFKAVQKLHPQSEPLANAKLTRLELDDQLNGWLTRHTWEVCRNWNWPYWINAQTNPASTAYINPALSPTLGNLACRDAAPIPGLVNRFSGSIDRRGMVTPPGAQYSIETWIRFQNKLIQPSQLLGNELLHVNQTSSKIQLQIATDEATLLITASAHGDEDFQFIRLTAACETENDKAPCPATIYFSIRPYNLECIHPIHDLVYNSKGFWMSDNRVVAWMPYRPDSSWASNAEHGDAAFFIAAPPERTAVRCPAGLATAISAFHLPLQQHGNSSAEILIPLTPTIPRAFPFAELVEFAAAGHGQRSFATNNLSPPRQSCMKITTGTAADTLLDLSAVQLPGLLDVANPQLHSQFLRRSNWLVPAIRSLLYHGNQQSAARLLQLPAIDIKKNGDLGMAAGRWNLHGQFLTAAADYHRLTREPASNPVISYSQLRSVARWIMRKRREIAHAPAKPKGLLPPGVNPSNTGTEYLLVDNLWALQGLASAAWLARFFGEHRDAEVLQKETTKYAANISAAIHRELEYSLSQQVPARLHRVFDPATAADLLEVVLMPDVCQLIRVDEWLYRLTDYLSETAEPQNPTDIPLRRIDANGIYPSRRILLCMAAHSYDHPAFTSLFDELEKLHTPLESWTECINPHTGLGCGQDIIDPAATALYTLLIRQLLLAESDGSLTFTPKSMGAWTSAGISAQLSRLPTIHGTVSANITINSSEATLELQSITDDPTVEISWNAGDGLIPLGQGGSAEGTYTHNLTTVINNTGN